jgi:hypothetical protein
LALACETLVQLSKNVAIQLQVDAYLLQLAKGLTASQ